MNNVRETINTMLVKTFHEILELEEKAIITDAVSYTHLDVYKRQIQLIIIIATILYFTTLSNSA